ncbi:unnamed protein product, partial [Rotaria magnacalcarata]
MEKTYRQPARPEPEFIPMKESDHDTASGETVEDAYDSLA